MRYLAAALAILISTATLAHADTPDYGALDVHGLLDSITDAQRAEYHIAIATWKESAPASVPPAPNAVAIPFPHAYILGSLEGVATYNEADSTINIAGLSILPTTYVLRIPASWNGRVVFFGPPGNLNHLVFPAPYARLMEQGYATAMVYAAVPGDRSLQPYEAFIDGYRTHDTVAAVFSTAHQVKDLLGAAFARPLKTYCLSLSGGTLFFGGLVVGRRGNPIDGYVMVVGGNGWRTETDEHMRAYRTAYYNTDPLPNPNDPNVMFKGVVPLTGKPTEPIPAFPGIPGSTVFSRTLDTEIGIADPEYRADVLALPEADRYLKLIAYDSKVRPAAVQRAWEELTFNPDLQARVIVVQGTSDGIQYPWNALVFTKRVIDAGRNEWLRLYMIKDFTHMFPPTAIAGNLDAVNKMVRWVEEGIPPEGTSQPPEGITFGTVTVQNNWATGFADDPCGYFHHQFGLVLPPADCGL